MFSCFILTWNHGLSETVSRAYVCVVIMILADEAVILRSYFQAYGTMQQ